jgi:hypothetical protein
MNSRSIKEHRLKKKKRKHITTEEYRSFSLDCERSLDEEWLKFLIEMCRPVVRDLAIRFLEYRESYFILISLEVLANKVARNFFCQRKGCFERRDCFDQPYCFKHFGATKTIKITHCGCGVAKKTGESLCDACYTELHWSKWNKYDFSVV